MRSDAGGGSNTGGRRSTKKEAKNKKQGTAAAAMITTTSKMQIAITRSNKLSLEDELILGEKTRQIGNTRGDKGRSNTRGRSNTAGGRMDHNDASLLPLSIQHPYM